MIDLRDIHKSYTMGTSTIQVLHGVALRVASSEFIALVGRSGSGKSTLMHIIGCLDRPDQGSYTLDGREVGALDDGARAAVRCNEIGFVFQSFHLIPRLSALENVTVPMTYAGVGLLERRSRARELLERVGLGPRADHRSHELSGGERQRVAIARSLANKPKLLLADEPTGNLDPRAAEDIMALFETLHRDENLTIVLVTHDMEVAGAAERVVTLVEGRIDDDAPRTRKLRVAGAEELPA